MRSLRAVVLVAVLAFIGVGVLASPADAHALLKRSYPAAGASLPRAPRAMLLFFTEAPEPSLSTVVLLDSSGRTVAGVGQPTPVPGNAEELRVALPRLADGVYTVNWRTVSKVNGHVTGGSFAFGIGVEAPSGGSAAQAAKGGSPSRAPLRLRRPWPACGCCTGGWRCSSPPGRPARWSSDGGCLPEPGP